MRGADVFQESLFTTVQLESFVPADHPLRAVKALLDEAMFNMNWLFESISVILAGSRFPRNV